MADLRILHLEDSQKDAELIREQLIHTLSIQRIDLVSDEQQFVRGLETGDYDLILADFRLPGFDATAALRLVKSFRADVPFIVVSGYIGEDHAVDILKQGATDYVLKDRLDKLPFAIKRALDEIKEHAARRQAEEALKISLAEKETLLRELYHRTKNNMQIISSLLKLYGEEAGSEKEQRTFQDMASRIESMALVQKELYESKNLASIEMDKYIPDLVNQLAAYYQAPNRKISYLVEIEKITLTVESAIPVGLIINELIINSIRHAFEGRTDGTIRIELRMNECGSRRLAIADDGIGLANDSLFLKNARMGLTTVMALARGQLKGKISYSPEGGFGVIIDF